MKQVNLSLSVNSAIDIIKTSLNEKGFTLFADINHQANAQSVNLELPESRVLIFGSPIAGTKLMQKDIFMSLDLPMRLAVLEHDGETIMFHQTSEDFKQTYQVDGHPILEKIEGLFSTLAKELNA